MPRVTITKVVPFSILLSSPTLRLAFRDRAHIRHYDAPARCRILHYQYSLRLPVSSSLRRDLGGLYSFLISWNFPHDFNRRMSLDKLFIHYSLFFKAAEQRNEI
jgi:hypothetical protein